MMYGFITENIYLPYGKLTKGVAVNTENQIVVQQGNVFVRYDDEQNCITHTRNIINNNNLIYLVPTLGVEKGDVIRKGKIFYHVLTTMKEEHCSIEAVNLLSGCQTTIIREPLISNINIVGFKKVMSLTHLKDMKTVNPNMIISLLSDGDTLEDEDVLLLLTAQNAINTDYPYNVPYMFPTIMSLMAGNKDKPRESELAAKLMLAITQNKIGDIKENNFGINPMIFMMMNSGEKNFKKMILLQMMMNNGFGCNNCGTMPNTQTSKSKK